MELRRAVTVFLFTAALVGCASRENLRYEDGFATVANGHLYYQVAGSGDAVLLIHGNAGDLRHWNNQFEYLASRYRVIRYDVRGYGKSSVPVIGSPYSDFSDLAELLDYLDVDDAHVIGWSMGSGVTVREARPVIYSLPHTTSVSVDTGSRLRALWCSYVRLPDED